MFKQSQYFRSTRSENAGKETLKTDIVKPHLKIPKINAVSAEKTTCKQLREMTGSNVLAADTGCTFYVLHTKNVSTAVEGYCERKTAKWSRCCTIVHSLQLRLSSPLG
jgi:hypothetical protein